MAGDDVLFQTQHIIGFTVDGGGRENLGRLLERSSRDPALHTQGGLGDTQQGGS